ncbi:MAG: hypothetical protein ACKVP5_22740 [Aestuariivirga sp.]
MQDNTSDLPKPADLRRMALSRWDNEGGAGPCGPQESSHAPDAKPDAPPAADVEIVQLRVRVIALENLMIAVLAEGTEKQRGVARAMAALIAPRPESTPHPLTTRAAAHMVDLVERSSHFRGEVPPGSAS